MASHILLTDVQQWLEPTKLTVADIDTSLEATAFAFVTSRLTSRYESGGWEDPTTTPQLVKSVESMWYAGMLYKRQYSENSDESGYGNYLLTYSNNLLDAIASGKQDLGETEAIREDWSFPQFWPTDDATAMADPDQGGDPTDPNAAPLMFTYGQVF
jgi:hypothetical protein